MANYILKDPCPHCSGKIVVITNMEMTPLGTREIISHGNCENCLRVTVMPQVEIRELADLLKRE